MKASENDLKSWNAFDVFLVQIQVFLKFPNLHFVHTILTVSRLGMKWENYVFITCFVQLNRLKTIVYREINVFIVFQVQRWIEDRRRHLREQEKVDAEVARRVAMEMTDEQRR